MPLRDFTCPACQTMRERYYNSTDALPVCYDCGGELVMQSLSVSYGKTGIFPYTTTHISGDGSPVTVESLGHLRSLEKRYGVMVHAFSQNPSNSDSPRDLPRHRPGGRESER